MPKNRFIRVILYILAGLLVLLSAFYIYFKIVTQVHEPEIPVQQKLSIEKALQESTVSTGHGWLKKVREGWWEMYLEGSPYEIGYTHGFLTKELNYRQEKAFLERLEELIPSKFYQKFMSIIQFLKRSTPMVISLMILLCQ